MVAPTPRSVKHCGVNSGLSVRTTDASHGGCRSFCTLHGRLLRLLREEREDAASLPLGHFLCRHYILEKGCELFSFALTLDHRLNDGREQETAPAIEECINREGSQGNREGSFPSNDRCRGLLMLLRFPNKDQLPVMIGRTSDYS